MDSLQEIMAGKSFAAPDELALVKDYVRRHYSAGCSVRLERDALVLSVHSSGWQPPCSWNAKKSFKNVI